MKQFIILLFLSAAVLTGTAQGPTGKPRLNIQLNAGGLLYTDIDEDFAYGGTVQFLIPISDKNLLTIGIKAMSNPFYGGKDFLATTNGFNKEGDALNYGLGLLGYRINIGDQQNGYLYVEPKAGVALSNSFNWVGFGMSPSFGFQMKTLDLMMFIDGGFGTKKLNTKRKSFVVPGIGVGFTF
mgnify:CR=1 FL=1